MSDNRVVSNELTKRQINVAARIWSLAMVYHTDDDGMMLADDVSGGSRSIREVARAQAKRALDNLGVDCPIHDELDAIDFVIRKAL